MVNEYKRIVLLQGLEFINDHYFSLFKSLMSSDLKLKRDIQEKYTKVQIADIMEDEFPVDAGLGSLIMFCKCIPALNKLAETLQKERSKVKGKTPLKKKKQEAGSAIPTSTTSYSLASEGGKTSTGQKRKSVSKEKTGVKKAKGFEGTDLPLCPEEATARFHSPIPQVLPSTSSNTSLAQGMCQNITRGAILQKDAMTVMVLNSTDAFEYESSKHGGKTMFHATVATVKHYFHVKIFNVDLKDKFKKNNVLIISNYFMSKGILEINETSSVVKAGSGQKIEVSKSFIQRANKTPKISDIKLGKSGLLIYGLFTLIKKRVNPKNTIYEVKDNTGSHMEVVGNGKWYNIDCEEEDKLQLYCFQLKIIKKQQKLVCGDHSFIEVTEIRKKKEIPTAHSSTKDGRENVYLQHQFCGFKEETPN